MCFEGTCKLAQARNLWMRLHNCKYIVHKLVESWEIMYMCVCCNCEFISRFVLSFHGVCKEHTRALMYDVIYHPEDVYIGWCELLTWETCRLLGHACTLYIHVHARRLCLQLENHFLHEFTVYRCCIMLYSVMHTQNHIRSWLRWTSCACMHCTNIWPGIVCLH